MLFLHGVLFLLDHRLLIGVCVCVCVFLVIHSSPLLMHRSSINHLILLCDIMCVQVTENKINPAHQLKDQ